MSTVGALVDRVRTDYLEPPDEMWARTFLTADVALDDTTWPLDIHSNAPEEHHMLSHGALVECEADERIVRGINNGSIEVSGATRSTLATFHPDGSEVLIQPPWTRASIFRAVADRIVALHPRLYAVKTVEVTPGVGGVAILPSDVSSPVTLLHAGTFGEVAYNDLGTIPDGRAIRAYCTDKAWLTYRARFQRPTSEQQSLAHLGIDESWGAIVVTAAAAQLIAGRPLSVAQQQYVTSQLRTEGYPVETPNRIRDSLLRFHQFLLSEAEASLTAQHPQSVQVVQ